LAKGKQHKKKASARPQQVRPSLGQLLESMENEARYASFVDSVRLEAGQSIMTRTVPVTAGTG
ncbi:hypothetical protein ABT215_27255, partial [Streptomyces sp900105755]